MFLWCLVFLYTRAVLLYGPESTNAVTLATLVVIVSLFMCLCMHFKQFKALDSPQEINPEKSNQTVFISTDGHFSLLAQTEARYSISCTDVQSPCSPPPLTEAALPPKKVLFVMKPT